MSIKYLVTHDTVIMSDPALEYPAVVGTLAQNARIIGDEATLINGIFYVKTGCGYVGANDTQPIGSLSMPPATIYRMLSELQNANAAIEAVIRTLEGMR
jgi:hypothetical protein